MSEMVMHEQGDQDRHRREFEERRKMELRSVALQYAASIQSHKAPAGFSKVGINYADEVVDVARIFENYLKRG